MNKPHTEQTISIIHSLVVSTQTVNSKTPLRQGIPTVTRRLRSNITASGLLVSHIHV